MTNLERILLEKSTTAPCACGVQITPLLKPPSLPEPYTASTRATRNRKGAEREVAASREAGSRALRWAQPTGEARRCGMPADAPSREVFFGGWGAGGAVPLQSRHVSAAKPWAASRASLHGRSHLFDTAGARGGLGVAGSSQASLSTVYSI